MLAHVAGLDPATFAAIGLVSVLSGSTNAPLAASIMALEMFGPEIGSFAAISCVISFIITGHRSIYPSQILAIKKSSYINIEIGKRIEKLELKYEFENPNNKFYIDHMMYKIVKFLQSFRFKKK